jgi:enoyl-CoA hydratase/carnithine racemase
VTLTCRETPVAAQIILRSGLRHFSAGADLDFFDKRAEQGRADLASENRRLNGVEYLRFMELLPIPLIASVHGLEPGVGIVARISGDLGQRVLNCLHREWRRAEGIFIQR